MSKSKLLIIIFICSLLSSVTQADANDVIYTNPKKSEKDVRQTYSILLLKEALKRTTDLYGPIEVQQFPISISRQRALVKLVAGEIDVFDAAARREWEETAIPIRIPLRKGIQGYRLSLIRSEDQPLFDRVNSLKELLKYRMGGGQQWSTTLAMKRLGIKVFGGTEYESLFRMLDANRFDYFPRGINEVFREHEDRRDEYPNMTVEEKLALYIPLPTYFFVTPTKPELAKRIKIGLYSMIEDGSFDKMFEEFHTNDIERANLKSRKIFTFANKNLSDETPLDKMDFWYQP